MDYRLLVLPAALLILAAIAVEWMLNERAGRRASVALMLGNSWVAVLEQGAGLLLYPAAIGLYAGVAAWAPVPWPTDRWFVWVAAVVLVDLAFYVYHRFCHRTALGWSLHAVHHQSPELNTTAAVRNSPFGGLLQVLFHLPLALIGVPTVCWVFAKCLNPVWQLVLHTELVTKLPVVEGWLNTPSAHRVHHGSQSHYQDRNLGGILVVWDRLFGTYQAEGEPPRYGTVPPLQTLDPVGAQLEPIHDLGRAVREHGWTAVLAPPGAGPDSAAPLSSPLESTPRALLFGVLQLLSGVVLLAAAATGALPAWAALPVLIVAGSLAMRPLRGGVAVAR